MPTGNKNAQKYHTFLGIVLVAGLLLSVSSCATIGRDFETSNISRIRAGITTQADILDMFGLPWRVGIEDGKPTWTYGNYHYNVFGGIRTKDLVVRFDVNNVVNSYTFNTTDLGEMKKPPGPGPK